MIEYYENGGGANASLYWTPPGGVEALVLQGDPVEDYDLIFQTKLTDSEGKVSFSWDEYQRILNIRITNENSPELNNKLQVYISSVIKECEISL